MTRRRLWLVLALLPALAAIPTPPQEPSEGAGAPPPPSCSVCHPGALASSRRSVHEPLVARHGPDASCLRCHTDAMAHQRAPRERATLPAPATARAACAACHGERPYTAEVLRLVTHPTRDLLRAAEQREQARELGAEAGAPGVPQADEAPAIALSGFVRAGWRLVDVRGDERAFDSDFGIDTGPLLLAAELRLRDASERTLLHGTLRGVGERRTSASLRSGDALSERADAEFAFSRDRWIYDRDGDFHSLSARVDRSRLELGAWFDDDRRTRGVLRWERSEREGTTITSRIGYAGQTPLVPATSVPAERDWRSDTVAVGLETELFGGTFAIEGSWLEERVEEDLGYARPSPANAAFTEREQDVQSSSRRGPALELRYAKRAEHSRGELVVRGEWLDTRYVQGGRLEAWDTEPFSIDARASGEGEAQRLLVRMREEVDVWDGGVLELRLRYANAQEDSELHTTDVTTRGSLVTTLDERFTLRTRFREWELGAGLRQRIAEGWALFAGWDYSRQYLSVPDLEAGDADFVSGTQRLHGPYAGLEGAFGSDLNFRIDGRRDESSGARPTEIELESGYELRVRLRQELEGDGYGELFGSYRSLENDVSATERVQETWGVALACAPWEDAWLRAAASWNRTDATTLSTFYFAPSTSPVPTRVGFRGENSLLELELDTPLATDLRLRGLVAFSYGTGSLRNSLLLGEGELVWSVTAQASLGLALQLYRYDDRDPELNDDYRAEAALLFGELRF